MTISWREVNGSASGWSLAGPTDTPPAGRAASAAALVQFTSTHLNQQSMNIAIRRMLEGVSPSVEQRFAGVSSRRGVFVVVTMNETRHPDGQRSLSDAHVHVYPDTFSSPSDALRRQREGGSISGESEHASVRLVRRYFFGVRLTPSSHRRPDPPRRRYIGGSTHGRFTTRHTRDSYEHR